MTLDHAALKSIAEKATQVQWKHRQTPAYKNVCENVVETCDENKTMIAECYEGGDEVEAANAAHIAAFSPPVALALLKEREEMRELLWSAIFALEKYRHIPVPSYSTPGLATRDLRFFANEELTKIHAILGDAGAK